MNIISWNVNGLRAVYKKGFLFDFVDNLLPDIFCLQETKAQENDLSNELKEIKNYYSFFSSAYKKGYSGVCVYSKIKPNKIEFLGEKEFDNEGRGLILYYKDFVLINCYFPNSQAEGKRIQYKINFCNYILKLCDFFKNQGTNVLLCGDYNIAPSAIDLEYPAENKNSPGYLPQEKEWFAKFLKKGYLDLFRYFYPDQKKAYTWWSYRTKARDRNIGWRIDHFCSNKNFISKIEDVRILSDVFGSDHCPVLLKILD